MKNLPIFIVYLLLSGGCWYLLSDERSLWRALIFGTLVGIAGVVIAIRQQRRRNG